MFSILWFQDGTGIDPIYRRAIVHSLLYHRHMHKLHCTLCTLQVKASLHKPAVYSNWFHHWDMHYKTVNHGIHLGPSSFSGCNFLIKIKIYLGWSVILPVYFAEKHHRQQWRGMVFLPDHVRDRCAVGRGSSHTGVHRGEQVYFSNLYKILEDAIKDSL